MNLAYAISAGMLAAAGVYFVLERTTFRVVVGLLLLSYAVNFMVALTGGIGAAPPIVEEGVPDAALADPLPQALVLTAIVITLGMAMFLLSTVVARVADGTGLANEPLDAAAPDEPVGGSTPTPYLERS